MARHGGAGSYRQQQPTEAGQTPPTEAGQTPPTEAGQTPPTEAGQAPPTEAGQTPPTEAGQTPPAEAGQTPPTEAGQTLPTEAGQSPPAEAGRTLLAETWWQCPWCTFSVSAENNSSKRTRLRQHHLRDEHTDKNADAQEARVQPRTATQEQRRMESIKRARVMNIKAVVAENKVHDLEYQQGFTIHCRRCTFTGLTSALPDECKATLHRGGQRLSSAWRSVQVPGDGLCMWHSIKHLLALPGHPKELRKRVCQKLRAEGGDQTWNDRPYRQWVFDELGISWAQYVRRVERGRTWPGVLEMQAAARLLRRTIEVYVKDGAQPLNPFKRILRFNGGPGAQDQPIRMEYQDVCHYEPIEDGTPSSGEGVGQPNSRSGDSGGDLPVEACLHVVLANISSWHKHQEDVLELIKEERATAAVLTETRIRTDAKSARHRAAEAGYQMLQSDIRPLKDGNQGPKEGGAAVLALHAAPNLYNPQEAQLGTDFAVHTALPLGVKHLLHIVGAYCEHSNPNNIAELIAYGESIGNVPVVLAADWNVTVDEGTVSRAIASGRWHDAAALTGDDAERATTHSGANRGRRVDYFLVNNAARPLVKAVNLLENHPLVNHYAVKLSLRVPDTELEVDELALTKKYRKIESIPDATGQLQEAWNQAARTYEDDAEPGPQHEKLWTRFCRLASAALETVLREKPKGRQKGAPPVTRKRALWAKPTPAGAANQHMLLPHRGLVLLRRLRQMLTQPAAEGRLLGVSRALNKTLVQCNIRKDGEFMTTDADNFHYIQQKLEKAAADAAKLTKRARVDKWREKVGGSLRAACRWLRGGQANVDVLDGPAGERLVHPQGIAEEVRRRCSEQFAAPQPQEEGQRAEFMRRFSHLMQNHPCELQPVQARRLRHFVTRKRRGAAGLDGWQAIELQHLPRDAWQLLAEICQIAEDSGEWPDSWTVGLVAALRKPNSTLTNIKLRMYDHHHVLYLQGMVFHALRRPHRVVGEVDAKGAVRGPHGQVHPPSVHPDCHGLLRGDRAQEAARRSLPRLR